VTRRGEPIPRVDVLGVGISEINMELAVAEIARWVEEREQHYVCVTGVHGIMESQSDPDLMRIHNESGLTTPDGMPMVWSARWAGASDINRVYGPDLMLEMCQLAATRGWTSFLYGGKEGVPELLAERLESRFPGLRVVGAYSPPFRDLTDDEEREIIERINEADPDFVWVGLGTPKQERWVAGHAGKLNAPALLAVGAAFDFHAGLVSQAPHWMQRSGLEWLYRLSQEPRRLWPRYVTIIPRFLVGIVRRRPRRLVVSSRSNGST